MTLILGMQCRDGAVIATDNEITAGDIVKTQEPKIRFKFKGTNTPFLFAYASNDVSYARRAAALLSKTIVPHKGSDFELFETLSEQCRIFSEQYPEEAEGTLLLLGLKMGQRWSLFSISGKVLAPEDMWATGGTGFYVSRPLLEQFYRTDLKVKEAAFIAAYVLHRAGQYATYVGNKRFDIALLQDQYASVFMEQWKINRLQRAFERFHECSIPLITAYADFDHPELFKKAMQEFSDKMNKYKEYEKKRELVDCNNHL